MKIYHLGLVCFGRFALGAERKIAVKANRSAKILDNVNIVLNVISAYVMYLYHGRRCKTKQPQQLVLATRQSHRLL